MVRRGRKSTAFCFESRSILICSRKKEKTLNGIPKSPFGIRFLNEAPPKDVPACGAGWQIKGPSMWELAVPLCPPALPRILPQVTRRRVGAETPPPHILSLLHLTGP